MDTKDSNFNRPTVPEILYKNGKGTASDNVNDVRGDSQYGTRDDVIARSFYGINHRQQPLPVPINKDYFGLTFFTRPELNMSTENLRTVRKFTPLLNKDDTSIQRIIRCTLDPRLANPINGSTPVTCPLIDNKQAFIPFLTNNLLSVSGFPDVSVPTYTSEPGAYGEVYSMVDGITDIYSSYDITVALRNMPGDPITEFFYYWTAYTSAVLEGMMIPYPEKIIEREVDYQTRIYRVVLDHTKTYVKKIMCCAAAFPLNAPIGAAANYESSKPINDSNDQISISFRALGYFCYDNLIIKHFNASVVQANPAMGDQSRNGVYRKIPTLALELFNTYGYPRIDPTTRELEWWIEKEIYESKTSYINSRKEILGVSDQSTTISAQNTATQGFA